MRANESPQYQREPFIRYPVDVLPVPNEISMIW